jgi:hypothetical protein
MSKAAKGCLKDIGGPHLFEFLGAVQSRDFDTYSGETYPLGGLISALK